MQSLIETFKSMLGPGGVLEGADVAQRRAGPWAASGQLAARAILRPRDTAEVGAIMRACHAAHQPVVAAGGLTGLVHGTMAGEGEFMLSLERMNRIEEIDGIGRTMTVQAGCVLQTLQEAAEKAGLMFPLDLGARGSCTIGGNVATNAGGNRVIRYGMTRELVLGLEVVLPDGRVLSSLNRMIKNNAGFDLKHLFIGSEGTLGIVTRLVLRLSEKPGSQNTAFVAIDSYEGVTKFLKHMDRALGGQLSAFEVLWPEVYELLTTPPARSRPPLPAGHAFYVLVEALGGDPEADAERFERALEGAFGDGLIADAALARSLAEREAMWAIRDDVGQFQRFQPAHGFDVSLPIRDMEAYVDGIRRTIAGRWPDGRVWSFGHLGDGNLHIVVSVGPVDDAAKRAVEEAVYAPLGPIRGSVSAEHGIGIDKRAYLHLSRTAEEIETMRRLKSLFDPHGILNPGKVIADAA